MWQNCPNIPVPFWSARCASSCRWHVDIWLYSLQTCCMCHRDEITSGGSVCPTTGTGSGDMESGSGGAGKVMLRSSHVVAMLSDIPLLSGVFLVSPAF